MSKRRKTIFATLGLALGALSLSFAPSALGYGEGFGLAKINTGEPGVQNVPAYPGTDAIWAGTCHLSDASTSNGGVGPSNGGSEPPTLRPHCIDLGDSVYGEQGTTMPWPVGGEPSWRLDPATQAGSHPDATAAFFFARMDKALLDGTVKNIIAKLPPGVVGNPEALPKCSAIEAQAAPPVCPGNTQAGISTIGFITTPGVFNWPDDFLTYPVYNIEARDTVTAEFLIGFIGNFVNVPITARGRTNGDYGIDTLALLVPDYAPIGGQAFTLWGVPWSNQHDGFRWYGGNLERFGAHGLSHRNPVPEWLKVPYDPSWGPIRPFFTQPTECTNEPLPVSFDLDSWQDPVSLGGRFVTGTTLAPPIRDCNELEFDPAITLHPDVRVADSPTGLEVELTIPQNNDPPLAALGNSKLAFDPDDSTGAPAYWRSPAGRATAHLKDTVVRLPQGTSFNPAAANGLRGCTTAQIGLTATRPKVTFNNDPHQCPDTSKMGTLEIVSPLLPDPLEGAVYAAPQHDNPFPGSLTAIYLVAQDYERGLSVKLAGKVDLDARTGQISTVFVDNPQLPFETFRLKFKTGPRAPLNTPAVCGQFKNDVDLTPWSYPHSGPIANIQDPFPIAQMPNGMGCVTEPEDRTFAPGFEAGSTSTQAGGDTDFVLNVTRRDGEQEVSSLNIDMAPGLVAKLAGTPYCSDATLAAIETVRSGLEESNGSLCPKASELGRVDTLAGAGPLPLPTSGKLYLAGPYQGAPLSVAAVVPAIAGGVPGAPSFDLGNVVVRSAAHVDPVTAQVKVRSAPLPYIVGGVPLRVRRISVQIDKPGFMRNPTNCSPMTIAAQLGGAGDPLVGGDESAANVSSRFQVGGCENLGFKPKLSLRLFGKTRRAAYQRLRATLTARPGDANISRAAVTMPRVAFLAQEHIKTVCTRVQWAADACPRASIYGRATAWTPLLDEPLSGNVYLRSSPNPLPDLVADLRGPAHQPIRVELVGRTDSVRRALRNTFDVSPDAAVSKFTLELFGGHRSLIVLSRNICSADNRAIVKLGAHNGLQWNTRPQAINPKCKGDGGKGKAKAKRSAHGRDGGKAKGRR